MGFTVPRAAVLVSCALLVCVSSGCSRGQAPAPEAVGSASGAASLPESARQVLRWLPGARPVAGWTIVGAPQAFGPDNLWESIDGGAETYVTFGFQELVRLTCRQAGTDAEATIEAYRMADAVGAFGIYAQERSPAATFVPVGAEGYTAPNIVRFWNGPYYVKLTSMKTDDRIAAALLALATEVDRRIGPAGPVPAGALALPARDQVPHSVKYVPRDILGQSYLVNGFEAQYRVGGRVCRLVTASFESPADAAAAFDRYRKFVRATGPLRATRKPIEEAFAGSDSFNGPIVATRSGGTIAIALGASSDQAALDLISAFYSRSPQGIP